MSLFAYISICPLHRCYTRSNIQWRLFDKYLDVLLFQAKCKCNYSIRSMDFLCTFQLFVFVFCFLLFCLRVTGKEVTNDTIQKLTADNEKSQSENTADTFVVLIQKEILEQIISQKIYLNRVCNQKDLMIRFLSLEIVFSWLFTRLLFPFFSFQKNVQQI